jgi:hypothetical protein
VGKRATRVLVAVAGIVVVSACSGANTTASPPTRQTAPAPTSAPSSPSALRTAGTATTGRPRATTTTATRTPAAEFSFPEFSFDESVPPPKLVNTGTDYVAILKSLVEYGNWLGAHRPNPTLTASIVARGTKLYDLYVQDLTRLRANSKRGIETLGGQSQFTILSVRPDAFSAKVVEDILVQKTVVASGRVTSEVHFREPTTYLRLAVLVGGRWYLAASEIQRPVNVHL